MVHRRLSGRTATVILAALPLALVGCGAGGGNSPDSEGTSPPVESSASPTPTTSSPADGTPPTHVPAPSVAGTVAGDLDTPWGLTFLPDDTALLSERDTGLIKRIGRDGMVSEVGEVPDVRSSGGSGEGGLLGIAYRDRVVYAYYTADVDNRVVAMSYDPAQPDVGLGEPRVIVDGIPQASFHNGGRIAFGPDDYLYVATGDGTVSSNGQDMDSLGGKILRVTTDGKPAPGNPFPGSRIWSLGHRNIEGLAWDAQGRLWASEFGADSWDELNLIRKGKNYGWPEAEGSDDGQAEFVDPVSVWRPEEASPAGLAYADGALWMAALRGERLWRIEISEGPPSELAAVRQAFFTEEYGRLRSIEPAPDGSLWLTTSDTDGRTPSDEIPTGADRVLRLRLGR